MAQVRLCIVSSCLRGTEERLGELCSGGNLHTFLAADNTSAVRISSFLGLSLSKGLNLVRHAGV